MDNKDRAEQEHGHGQTYKAWATITIRLPLEVRTMLGLMKSYVPDTTVNVLVSDAIALHLGKMLADPNVAKFIPIALQDNYVSFLQAYLKDTKNFG